MYLLIIEYASAFIGTFIIILGIALLPEIKNNKRYRSLAIILGIVVLFLELSKIYSDNKKEENNISENKSLNGKVNSLNEKIDSLNGINLTLVNKLDSHTVFLKRLEKIGIKDSLSFPTRTQIFTTNVNEARDLYIGSK